MALVVADRVKDTTTTTGTGTVTLSGTAPTGYQNFAVIGNGNTTYYTIAGGSEWEVGVGTYATSGPTLARTTVLASTNGGNAVSFSAGTKDVFVTYPAEVATALTNPVPTNGGVVYGTGTAIGVSAAGVVNGYQFLQSAGAASPTWVQINSFKDVATAPTSPTPIEGDRFFDNTTGIDYTYITDVDGSQWVETSATGAASNVYTKTTFTATASQTTFTLNYNVGYVDVYLNGVKLTVTDFTASSGTTVVLAVAAALNDIVETIAWTTWAVTNTAIGAGTGTSLALNGATLGSNALAVSGSSLFPGSTSISSAGLVGVGMTPVRTLDVTGTFGATGAATLGSTVTVAGGCAVNGATLYGWNADAGFEALQINNAQTAVSGYATGSTQASAFRARVDTDTGNLINFYRSTTQAGRFISTGGGTPNIQWLANNQAYVISGGSGGVTLASAATAWAAVSDETLKTDLTTIQSGAEKVGSLRAVTGRYKTDAESMSRSFLIAQDVQKVLPEAVSTDADGTLSLRYTEVIPLMVAAIQELTTRLAALEAK